MATVTGDTPVDPSLSNPAGEDGFQVVTPKKKKTKRNFSNAFKDIETLALKSDSDSDMDETFTFQTPKQAPATQLNDFKILIT